MRDGRFSCDDPVVLAAVEEALLPYRALLTDELLVAFREELIYGLTEHPVAKALVDRMRPRLAPDESGEVAKPAAEAWGAGKKAASRGSG